MDSHVPFRILKILVMLICEDDQGGGYHSFEERLKSYCSQMFFDKQEHIKMKINTIIKKDPLTFLKFFVEYLSMVVKMNLMPHNRVLLCHALISPNDVKELREEKITFHTLGSDEEVVQVYKGLKTYGADNPLLFKHFKRNIQEHYNSKGKIWIAELIDTFIIVHEVLYYRHTPVRVHSKAAVKLSNVEASIIWVKKSQLRSALRRVDKYILATQTISHLEDERPRLKKKRKINWLLRALFGESEARGTVAYNLYLSYLHVLKTVPECIYCAAKRLEHEPPIFYFASGYIKLANTKAPTELYEMFVASTPDAVEFCKNIRAYNSIFAFTCFGVNLDKELESAKKGVYEGTKSNLSQSTIIGTT
uniref:Uncharacterized protein n=1 Tax=Solanum lycopersicum TaxID=4081 RepID=A0A3Q7G1J9_SOLLC